MMQEDEENRDYMQNWKKKHVTEKLVVTEKGPALKQNTLT